MSLLELRCVCKSSHDRRQIDVLREVSLELEAGELLAVWGLRHSGRTTLLRVAAGVDQPDTGVVLFDGSDLSARGTTALGVGVGYCQQGVGVAIGRRMVLNKVRAGLLGLGVPVPDAHARAHKALERVGIERPGELMLGDLDGGEAMRVEIACALVLGPRVLVIDEPTKGVGLLDRDEILLLLRSLANEGIAILMSDGDGSGLPNADRALTLADGELHGKTSPSLEAGSVLPLRRVGRKSTAA